MVSNVQPTVQKLSGVVHFGVNAGFSWLRFSSGFGDYQGHVLVAEDHSGRKEMLHDFNGIISIGLTRSSSVVTARVALF